MTDEEIRQAESLERVDVFGTERAAAFPATSQGGKKFAAIKSLLAELHEVGEAQAVADGAARSSAVVKRTARTSIVQKLRTLRNTAKALDGEKPGTSDKFRLPPKNSDEMLINFARVAVTTATPLKSSFLQLEMPSNFLEDLSAAIDEFEEASNTQNISRSNRISATAGVKDALARGTKLKRDLDPIVRNKYAGDPASLAAWTSAARVQRPRQSSKKGETPAPKP